MTTSGAPATPDESAGATPLPRLQHRADLIANGFTPAELQNDILRGRLFRIRPGSYVDAAESLSASQRYLLRIRAVAHRSPQLIVSHLSALAVHGFSVHTTNTEPAVHLIRIGQSGAGVRADRVVHAISLLDDEIEPVDELRVTVVARSLIDVARHEVSTVAVPLLTEGLRTRRVLPGTLETALARVSHRKGSPAARRALDTALAAPGARGSLDHG